MSIQILLPCGRHLLVDPEDADRVGALSWRATVDGRYVRASGLGARKIGYAHRFIMGAKIGQLVDHEDGDGFNCIRKNLRLATKAENGQNRGIPRTGSTGYKGVSIWYRGKDRIKFQAQITSNGARYHLGGFYTTREAALAYDAAAIRLHGQFARTNASLNLL